jgi:diadenylate cyclase
MFLPLTTNPAVPVNLGTRHRAAIGITEESDCLSLVVSEETGHLSVAAHGEIHAGVSLDEMDALINTHLGVDKHPATVSDVLAARQTDEDPRAVEKAG